MPTVNGKKYPYTPAGKAAAKKAAGKQSYVGNVIKEVKQTAKRVSNAVDKADKAAYEKKYGRKLDVKIGSSKIKEQVGQLAGAVLQGRRYDDKTGKQIVTPKKLGPKRTTVNPLGTPTMRQRPAKPKGTPLPKRTSGPIGSRTETPKKMKTFKATSTSTPQLPKSTKNLGKMTKKAYK